MTFQADVDINRDSKTGNFFLSLTNTVCMCMCVICINLNDLTHFLNHILVQCFEISCSSTCVNMDVAGAADWK